MNEGDLYLITMIGGYFLPAIIALWRNHANAGAITVLTLFLGWTFIGWVGALVWASTSNVRKSSQQRA